MVGRFRRVVLDTAGRTRFSRMQSRQQAAMISASTASACHRSISGSAVKRRAMTRLSIRRHLGPPTTSSLQPRCSLSDIYMPRGNQDGSAYCLREKCSRRRDRCLFILFPEHGRSVRGSPDVELAGLRNDRPPPYRTQALSPRNCVDPRHMSRRSKQQRACLLAAPGFQAALKRSQQLVRVRARILRL